jgi:hypothetical protein
MQRHVDIYRHKVIMGIHNRIRRDKKGELIDSFDDGRDSQMDLEINQEIPIDDPSQVVLHKEMFLDITSDDRDIRVG